MVANVQSMFYTGETPWHGLGKKVDHVLTSAEAIDAASLNWIVEKQQLFLANGKACPTAFATVRLDTGAVLGRVGPVYTVLQNKSAFSLADAIVGIKEAMYHTAGALGEGERVWMLLKVDGLIRTTKDDVTEKYLLLSNSHDGSSAVEVMFTPIRVVCQNTLNAALSGTINKARVRHTTNMGERVEDVRKTLGFAVKHFDLFEQASQALVGVRFRSADLKKFAQDSGAIPVEKKGEEMTSRAKNIMEEISSLFEMGKGTELQGVKGTAWAAYNAMVEYVDYKRGKDANTRAASQLYGSGRRIKQGAWDSAMSLVGGRP